MVKGGPIQETRSLRNGDDETFRIPENLHAKPGERINKI
jgi:hypothetical protein